MEFFEMIDLGLMTYFLGMEIKQNDYEVFICQKKYGKEILKKFEFEECKDMRTPMNSSEWHLKAAKRVLRYVKGTSDFGIKFTRSKEFKLLGFSDSDWGGSIDDMKSTSGYFFTLGSRVFSWSSKKQEIIAQSTTEAEFVAATAAVNQALWLRNFLIDLNMEQEESTQILVIYIVVIMA
ncbi:secreted RxLR effector protein 161-like [Humulus lupulus]|uniref:secreted RxLR effector protein 161-like n=1 Tax=Humulus lupulus TaxID=3486 RepID=UPI002B40504B|nr:secreted RxLR effector protein 161-like [Humulus lupulus]